MKRGHVVDFKVAGIPCRLIIDDKLLFDYFNENYWTNKYQNKANVHIDIKGTDGLYEIKTKPVKLDIKVDMKKKHLLFKDIDWIVRTMIQYNLLKYKIIFLHSSSAVFKNKAFIFLGKSGKGKSTLISNFGNSIIGDDIIILKKQGNAFYSYQSPFEKSRIQERKILIKTKIASLFSLRWGDRLLELPITPQEMASLLLSDNYIPRLPRINSDLYTELIFDLIKRTKITRLLFPKKFDRKDLFIKYE